MRAIAVVSALAVLAGGGACSLITVEQQPFPPLEIRAKRPAPPPPRVVLTASSIQIKDKIQFKTGSAEILPASFGLLGDIAAVMKDNAQIEVLQVEGHTDSVGGAAYNQKLSRERAESVRAWLVKQGGIEAKRLVAKGFGLEKPIADNATEPGREQNRRVEFNIVKQGPKKTVVQDE